MIDSKLVVGQYKQTNSIRKTAFRCGCSEQKVRKILVTQGIYCTPLVTKINDYYNKGYTVQEIANKLQISIKSVKNCLPYTRGQLTRWDDMDAPRSATAIAVKKSRDKRKKADKD